MQVRKHPSSPTCKRDKHTRDQITLHRAVAAPCRFTRNCNRHHFRRCRSPLLKGCKYFRSSLPNYSAFLQCHREDSKNRPFLAKGRNSSPSKMRLAVPTTQISKHYIFSCSRAADLRGQRIPARTHLADQIPRNPFTLSPPTRVDCCKKTHPGRSKLLELCL